MRHIMVKCLKSPTANNIHLNICILCNLYMTNANNCIRNIFQHKKTHEKEKRLKIVIIHSEKMENI